MLIPQGINDTVSPSIIISNATIKYRENMQSTELIFRNANIDDSELIKNLMHKYWGGEPLVVRGQKYYPSSMDGIMAFAGDVLVGFLFYEIQNLICEIVALEVFNKFNGVGTKLVDQVKQLASAKGCKSLHLMTTNDNLDALRFYQRRGFHICAIHIDSVKTSRKIKPSIGEIGDYGIAVRDEIDLELKL